MKRWISKEQKDMDHEKMRIRQAEEKSKGDDQKFRSIILLRATRCGDDKRERFIEMLKKIGRSDLAGFIEMTFKSRSEE